MSGENEIRQFEYKAEMKQLLNLIVHSLYTHPEVFLRELVSNASDALSKVRFLMLTDKNIIDPDKPLEIRIDVDNKQQTFSIEDNGIGMTDDELVNNIGTIARSGTLEFLKSMQGNQKLFDEALIGRFGVGFYSVFMVADEVTVETRHARADSKGFRWRSTGEGAFTIEEIEKKTRGTRIYFKLKDTAKEFSLDYKVKDIINKYSNFADFPILLDNEKVNKVTALWHRKTNEIKESEANDFYKFITNDFDDPLGFLHLSIEGNVNFKALIFIPSQAPLDIYRIEDQKSLNLYANKVLIQADARELLPDYLKFVKGVVDTTDLPLNVSREVTQSSPAMARINNILTSEILAFLEKWAQNEKDKYRAFYGHFSRFLKAGITMDFKSRDKIINLLRFESTALAPGEWTTLKEYTGRIKPFQKDIYYLAGQKRDTLEKNPNLEYFRKHEVEVLFLTDPVDAFVVPAIADYDGKKIVSIEKKEIGLFPEDKIERPEDNLSKSLIGLFKDVLKDRVENVVISKRLVESPVTLVTGKDGADPQMERMMELMNRGFVRPKKIMEVNMEHPLIKNLAQVYMASNANPLLGSCILQLYDGALLLEGDLPTSADFVRRMTEIMEAATQK
ncbi:MAG: molecular chaperone HtpG [Candidatus Omnitrophica bacterium]|nr:molecular chaperone HtpG [Candidatus Omnitrophota bacterium]